MRALHTLVAIAFSIASLSLYSHSKLTPALIAALIANVSIAAIGIEIALSRLKRDESLANGDDRH